MTLQIRTASGGTRDALTRNRVDAIMTSRLNITPQMAGEVVGNIQVVGTADGRAGNFLSAEDMRRMFPDRKQHFDTWLFNTNAKSELAVESPEIKSLCERACRLETAAAALTGEQQTKALLKADELFNEYLNSTQIGFRVIAPATRKPAFYAGQPILGTVELVTAESGNVSLQLRSVKPRPAVKAERTVSTPSVIAEIPEGYTVDLETGELVKA